MVKVTGPSKDSTRNLIRELKKYSTKTGEKLWKDIALRLSKPRRNRTSINLSKINALSAKFEGKILLVPGKVLGTGEIGTVKIAALEFSETALKKLKENAMDIETVLNKKMKAKDFVIIK